MTPAPSSKDESPDPTSGDPYAAPRAEVDDRAASSFPPALSVGLGLLFFGLGSLVMDPVLEVAAIPEALTWGGILLGTALTAVGITQARGGFEG